MAVPLMTPDDKSTEVETEVAPGVEVETEVASVDALDTPVAAAADAPAADPAADPAEVAPEPAGVTEAPAEGMASVDAMAELGRLQVAHDALQVAFSTLSTQAAEMAARLEVADACVGSLRIKLAAYELAAALSSAGLPPTAGPLVSTIYDLDVAKGFTPLGIREWLPGVLANHSHPAAVLASLKSATPVDPSMTAPATSVSHLRPFPTVGQSR